MTGAADIPVWAALLVGALALAGAGFTLLGCLGLVRLGSFYERIHAPTLGTSFGTAGVMLASIVYFSIDRGRLGLHEVLILVFTTVTTPVTLVLLARAALYRDRTEGSGSVPPAPGSDIVVKSRD